MKKTITIEPEHFDDSVKQPWNDEKCLIAQCMIANGMNVEIESPLTFAVQALIRSLQMTFDKHFCLPGDETKPELVDLRASLPISVEVEV